MPRNGSGVYSKPAGTTAVPDTIIESAKYNATIDDLVEDANTPRPITAGGTAAGDVASARANLGVDKARSFTTKSADYTAVADDKNRNIRFTAAATLALTAAATLGANWYCTVQADGGVVTIDPDVSETINGAATLILANGEWAAIFCNGTAFFAAVSRVPINPSYVTKSADYTALDADYLASIRFTAAATLSFDTTANLRTNWRIEVWNDSTGNVIIDPASTDTINGAATLTLQAGQKAEIFKTGATTFQASIFNDALSGPQLQGYISGLALTTNASDTANDIDFGAGAAASDTSPYYLMQFSAMTKRLDAVWSAGNNGGMLDTGTVGNNTYYFYGIQRSDTLATDFIASLSSSGPLMPTNYDRKRLIGSLNRVSASNLPPQSAFIRPSIFSGTVVTLSGVSTVLTGIPPGVQRVIMDWYDVAPSASAAIGFRLGDATAILATGYSGAAGRISGGAASSGAIGTTSANIFGASSAAAFSGKIILTKKNGNIWSYSGEFNYAASTLVNNATITGLTSDLSRIEILTGGAQTLSGEAKLTWEF